MVDIAEGLLQSDVRRWVAAGGETSGEVVDCPGIPGFPLGDEIAALVPVTRGRRQRRDVLLALKSGSFGGPEFFSDAPTLMR